MIPGWLQALVLGIVQGLSEFMPISSDGHLVLVPYLLGWEQPSLAFVVALHVGTLAAVLVYFRRDLGAMLAAVTGRAAPAEGQLYRRLALLIMLGSVPVAVVGFLFKERIETVFASPRAAAAFLFFTAALLATGEKARDRRVATHRPNLNTPAGPERRWTGDSTSEDATTRTATTVRDLRIGRDDRDPTGASLVDLRVRHALIVGLMQSVALLPGVSRSGSTITGGLLSGLTREAATRFSFLLSIPALIGASMLSLGDLAEPGSYRGLDIAVGVLAAFVSGYLAIRWLVAWVARDRLTPFAWYCVAAGTTGLLGYLLTGPPSTA